MLDVIRHVGIQRRRGTRDIQFAPPRSEESLQFGGSRSRVRTGAPAGSKHVPVATARRPRNVGDGWRRPRGPPAAAAAGRRRVGAVVVGDDGEDDGVRVATAGVRRRAAPQLPQTHPERVDVGGGRDGGAAQQLRRAVRQRPGERRRARPPRPRADRPDLLVVQTPRTAEVGEFTAVSVGDDDVGRLHVEVDESPTVNERQRRRHVVRVTVHTDKHTSVQSIHRCTAN